MDIPFFEQNKKLITDKVLVNIWDDLVIMPVSLQARHSFVDDIYIGI